jgi:hypothetical protein
MKSVILDLPDNIAFIFEALPKERKLKAALLAAFFAQVKPKSVEEVLSGVDKQVAKSGLSEKEIDQLLDELS